MKLLNNFNKTHLGMGVILFEKVLSIDNYNYISYIESLKEDAVKKDYTIIYDDKNQPVYAINRSGHRYSIENMNTSASHIMNFINSKTPKEIVDFFVLCEKAMHLALLNYIETFPMLLPSIWWRTQGHILAYGPGSEMGLHSDNDVNYQPGFEPDLQLATRNVVGTIVYLNSSVDSMQGIKNNDYLGGEIEFVYAKIKYKPKAGDILMFPSNYLGAHQVHPCSHGNRYAYIGYYCQGSEAPERGIQISRGDIPVGLQGQIWMDSIVNDYIDHISKKYIESSKEKKLLLNPTLRKFNSSKTMEELNNARQ